MNEVLKRIRYSRRFYVLFCIAISIMSMIVCLCDTDRPSQFSEMWLLPLGHLVISAFLYGIILKGDIIIDIPVLIVSALLTIRNSLTPMMMALDTYRSKVGIANESGDVRLAIIVYLFETAAIMIYIVQRKTRNKANRSISFNVPFHLASKQIFLIVTGVGVVLSISSFILLPELRTQYYTIFNSNFVEIVRESVEYEIGAKRALSTASDLIITGTRLSLSAYLIYQIRKKGDTILQYLLCLGIILAQFFLMNDSNAFIIMFVISLYFLVYKLFPRYAKKTIKYLALAAILFGVLIYNHRIVYGAYRQSSAMWMQAYLPGINNFTAGIDLLDTKIVERVSIFFSDLFAAIPFRSTLFGYNGGLMTSPLLWGQKAGALNQIMPNSFQSYYYFGFVFSPLLSVLSVKLAMDIYEKAQRQTNPCMYVMEVYLVIYLSIVPTMYNLYIFLKMLLSRGLFMWIFAVFYPQELEFEKMSSETNV